MTSIGKVLTNSTLLYAFPHTIGAAVMTGGMLVVGVSAWHLARGSNVADVRALRSASRFRSCSSQRSSRR